MFEYQNYFNFIVFKIKKIFFFKVFIVYIINGISQKKTEYLFMLILHFFLLPVGMSQSRKIIINDHFKRITNKKTSFF